MKKMTLIMAFIMAVLVANAQVTRVTVKPADLPKALSANVTKNYAGFNIKEATKVTENKVVTFHVLLAKGTVTENLLYDKDGNFLRKILPPSQPLAHAGQKHDHKTPPPVKK